MIPNIAWWRHRVSELESQVRDCEKHNEILKQSELRLLKEVRDLTGERERERQALGNLLAVIHRDGGHYQAEHGSKKAAEDAETLVCWLRDNVERLERLMADVGSSTEAKS